MKFVFATLFAVSTQATFAKCLGEAQIIAKVASITLQSKTSCVVLVSPNSIDQYNVNGICPLQLAEVINQGVVVDSENGQCALQPDQVLTGVLVKTESGAIVLE